MIIDRVVPGLYYAADSAAIMSVAERRTPYEPPRRRRRGMRLSCRGRRARRGSTGGPPSGRPLPGRGVSVVLTVCKLNILSKIRIDVAVGILVYYLP